MAEKAVLERVHRARGARAEADRPGRRRRRAAARARRPRGAPIRRHLRHAEAGRRGHDGRAHDLAPAGALALARPELLFLLLLGALAGIGAELSHLGLLFPGILGVFCLILFLFASQVLPVNGAGVLMMVRAIALFAAEVKVTSYGL